MTDIFLIIVMIISVISVILSVMVLVKSDNNKVSDKDIKRLRDDIAAELRLSRQESSQVTTNNINSLGELLKNSQDSLQKNVIITLGSVDERFKGFSVQTEQKLDNMRTTMENRLTSIQEENTKKLTQISLTVDQKLQGFSIQTEQKLDNMRTTMENRLAAIQDESTKKLEQVRHTVDEKLQKTLDDKFSQSFKLVSERLEQVYKGLGEMQTLATGVGDLKKVLSNVKTRGVLGEIQLGAILEQMLAVEQYEKNIVTKKGTNNPVEFAVKMPNETDGYTYLPIDAKFPMDAYSQLLNAYDSADSGAIEVAQGGLCARLKRFAKDISEKYIDPPNTTDFGIMFLPVEGLYAEAVRLGLVEVLQRDYKISIAGPTTMAALLNSLQMGFRTLAIQKRSSEVWEVLGSVRSEFDKFAGVLQSTQDKINRANEDLDKLIGVRTRQIQRKLKDITVIPGFEPKEEDSGFLE